MFSDAKLGTIHNYFVENIPNINNILEGSSVNLVPELPYLQYDIITDLTKPTQSKGLKTVTEGLEITTYNTTTIQYKAVGESNNRDAVDIIERLEGLMHFDSFKFIMNSIGVGFDYENAIVHSPTPIEDFFIKSVTFDIIYTYLIKRLDNVGCIDIISLNDRTINKNE